MTVGIKIWTFFASIPVLSYIHNNGYSFELSFYHKLKLGLHSLCSQGWDVHDFLIVLSYP